AFRFALDPAVDFRFIAGQYVMVDVPKGETVVRKAYSIVSPPFQAGSIDLCIKHVEGGYVSTYFHEQFRVGDALTISDARGNFVDRGGDRERVYVAAGTGIAPIRSMILGLYDNGFDGPMTLYFGVRHEDEILYETDWRRLEAAHTGFRFIPAVSRPRAWTGRVGWVQNALRETLTDPATKTAYVCGLVPMVKEVKALLIELGVPREQIHTEKYT
ncbi:MAG TPA: FAD-binding oxidoreductase, partial [Nitrospiria bacterium]|nr:FAD-binding oxidoreductase [Nitrospiria bacterium]